MRLSQEAIQRMISGRSGGGAGGGGSFDPSALAGMASQAWVEEGYISKAFWNELFIIHKKVTTVVMNGETEVSRTVKTDADAGVDPFDPNETPSETSTTDSETGYVTTVTTEIESIEARKGVWTDYFLSALGKNSSGGGGGATLFEPLLSINESGLAAPADAQNGMTVVWDKNTHKWKYGATGGGTSLSLTPGCLLDTVDNYSYNDYIGQWSQQNIKGSAFLYDIGNANKVYYSASGNHIPNGIRLLWYDKNLFLIGKTDYGIQSEYSVPTGAVYVSFVLYYSITEIAYIEDGLSNINFSFLGNDKIYISKDLEYPYGNPDTYNVNLDDYSDSYIEGVASDADYKKFFTDGRGKSICIPFSLFKYYDYVEIKQPSPSKAGISRIHFLKKEPKTNGETVEYSDFYTTNVQINKGNNTIFYKIPNDARYILIYAYWGNEDRRPERIALRTANSLGLDDMSKYDERVNTALRNPNQYQIKILHWNIGNYSNGGSETSINDSNYTAKSNSFKAFINKYKDHNVYINEWNSVFAKLSGGNVYAGPELWGYGYSYSSYVRCNDWDELGCVPTNTQISHKVGVLTSLAGMYLESGGYYSMPKPYVIYRHYIGGGSLYILHTHLPTGLSKQQHQTVFAEMVNIMSGYTNAIICGDLNLYDQSALETFTNAGYTIANNDEPTYPSSGSHYDWFVYKGNFTNVSFKVCKDAVDSGYSEGDTSHMLSDHWPIELILNYTGDSIVPAVRGASRFNPTTNVPQWHNGNEWFTFIKHDEVGTNDLTGLSGSFFFGGNDALQSDYDYVGFQAGNSLDKWQMVAIDSLKWRQNDSGGTNSTNWTAWKTILDSNNSGIVDGHKVKLNDTSIEVPVAYNIPSPGSFTSGYWHKLGDYVTAGDNSNLVLNIYDGNGYNANAEQNSILRVVIKDGWQSTRAAADSVGVTIERFGVWAADMQISIVATDHNAGAVWIYFPWQYAAGTYVVSGNYNTWTHNSSTSSDTTTAPTTNQTKNSTGSHSYLYLDNAYTNSNVASATKLQTARLLWGNSFDGTADVNGDITITKTGTTPALMTVTNGTGTVRLAAYETNRGIWDDSGSGWLIGTGPTSSNPNTFLMRGNVGIGKSSPSYKLDVDGTINCTSIRIGGYTITADTTNQGLRINSAGLYADTYISALGANSGGGGGGGVTLNEPLSGINNASLGTPSGTDMAIVWTGSAWGYKYVPDNGGGGGGGSGTVTSIKITVPTGFSISPTSAITTSGTFAITFASGYSLPTTAKQSNWDTAYNNNHQHSNKSVLDGITSPMVTKWNACVNSSEVTTQLQNYAYITNDAIHIGDNSITPLTSHQSVDGTFWGRSWSNHNTVSGSIEAGNSGGYIGGFDHIDLNTHASLLDYGGYIDFYYEGANSYTSRIIEENSGLLALRSPNTLGLLVGGYNGDYVQIGQIRIVYESSNNALRIENANNGGAANLYAMGGISALGMSGNADGTISGNLIPSANATYSIGSSSYGWKELRLSQYGVSGRITIDGDGINIVSNEGGYLSGALYMVTGRMIVGASDDDYDGFTFATEGTSYLSSKVSIGGTNSNSDKLYVNGTVRASSYNNSSDARLKNIISNENINIETIARAPIVRFTWKNTDDPRVHWGTLAQYWRSTEIGDIVEDGEYLAMDYAATALAGVISVARKVMTHEERIAALEAENKRLRNEIETLKAA